MNKKNNDDDNDAFSVKAAAGSRTCDTLSKQRVRGKQPGCVPVFINPNAFLP